MIKAVINYYRNIFNFKDRASRSDFWWVVFFNLGLLFIARLLLVPEFGPDSFASFSTVFSLINFLPGLSLWVRRMHDMDKSGWFLLIFLLVPIGPAILLVMLFLPGTPEANRFGEVPVLKRLQARRQKRETTDKREKEQKYRKKLKTDKQKRREKLKPADLSKNSFLSMFFDKKVDLSGRHMSGSTINKCEMEGVKAQKVNFGFANLSMSRFINVDFTGSNFSAADLRASHYEGVNFSDCDMRGADLRRADFEHCNFSGANMRDAKVERDQHDEMGLSADQIEQIEWYDAV